MSGSKAILPAQAKVLIPFDMYKEMKYYRDKCIAKQAEKSANNIAGDGANANESGGHHVSSKWSNVPRKVTLSHPISTYLTSGDEQMDAQDDSMADADGINGGEDLFGAGASARKEQRENNSSLMQHRATIKSALTQPPASNQYPLEPIGSTPTYSDLAGAVADAGVEVLPSAGTEVGMQVLGHPLGIGIPGNALPPAPSPVPEHLSLIRPMAAIKITQSSKEWYNIV